MNTEYHHWLLRTVTATTDYHHRLLGTAVTVISEQQQL